MSGLRVGDVFDGPSTYTLVLSFPQGDGPGLPKLQEEMGVEAQGEQTVLRVMPVNFTLMR